jgi:hypothetical protein
VIVRDWLFDARERRAGASGPPGKSLAGNGRKECGNLPLNVKIRITINTLVRGGGRSPAEPVSDFASEKVRRTACPKFTGARELSREFGL